MSRSHCRTRLKWVVQLNPAAPPVPSDQIVTFLPMDALKERGGMDLRHSRTVDSVRSGYTAFVEGDVVVAKITPCFENGKASIAQGLRSGIGFGTTELHVLRPKKVNARWLFYLIQSSDFMERGKASMYGAGGQKRVPADFVLNFEAEVPSPAVQLRVADFLAEKTAAIDALIEKKERLVELLQEKRQALITQAVTKGLDPTVPMKDSGIEWLGRIPAHWEVMAIKRDSTVRRGASPRPIDDPRFFDEGGEYAWVRISDVSASDGILFSTTQRLSAEGASLSVKLHPGDLFLSIAGSVGIPCVAGVKLCIHDGFVYFPRLIRIEPSFLFFVFASGQPYRGLGKLGTQLNLNTDTVGSIRLAVPPQKEQADIVARLKHECERLDSVVGGVSESIELLREYRQAIITAAVTGQLDVAERMADEAEAVA